MIYIAATLTVQFRSEKNPQIDRFENARRQIVCGVQMGDNQVKIVHSFGGWRPPVAKATQRVLHKGIQNLHRNHGNPWSRLLELNFLSPFFWLANFNYSKALSAPATGPRFNFHLSIIQFYLFSYFHVFSCSMINKLCLVIPKSGHLGLTQKTVKLFTSFEWAAAWEGERTNIANELTRKLNLKNEAGNYKFRFSTEKSFCSRQTRRKLFN